MKYYCGSRIKKNLALRFVVVVASVIYKTPSADGASCKRCAHANPRASTNGGKYLLTIVKIFTHPHLSPRQDNPLMQWIVFHPKYLVAQSLCVQLYQSQILVSKYIPIILLGSQKVLSQMKIMRLLNYLLCLLLHTKRKWLSRNITTSCFQMNQRRTKCQIVTIVFVRNYVML